MTYACAACGVADGAVDQAGSVPETVSHTLVLPHIHCAGCIRGVEHALSSLSGVSAARVNLSLKRVAVQAEPGVAGASLVAALAQAGYEAHELDEAALGARVDPVGRGLVTRIGVAGFAMMNVMLLAVAVWSGASDVTRDLFHWISAAIALPAAFFAAQPFFVSAWGALRVARLNMDVPISLAIILASVVSLYETSQGGDHAYFDAALSLTFFLLIGRYLDYRMRMAARSAARELTALEIPRVTLVAGDHRTEVATESVQIGDRLWFAPGARMPIDGVIVEGESLMDRSFLTGESDPVAAGPGAEITAGEINLSGPLLVRAVRVGGDTSLRRIADLVAVAEGARGRYTGLADRAAKVYAPLVHLLALGAFIFWVGTTGDARLALNIAIAVLIITCPCALGLAVPAVATAATGRLFRRGLLVKADTALERLGEIETVVFDKTGTLTRGVAQAQLPELSADHRRVLKALAGSSGHPAARAVDAALDGVTPAPLTGIHEVPGEGIEACWNGQRVCLGSARLTGAAAGPAFRVGDAHPAEIAIAEELVPGAAQAVEGLRTSGS